MNFQFCGALVNYDMPWNPMRVEQRIGRIDRLGQRFADIRIVNLHYEDTIEADVYSALSSPLRKCRFQFAVGARRMVTTSAAGSASMSAIRPKTSSELVCKTKMKAARASAASLGVP